LQKKDKEGLEKRFIDEAIGKKICFFKKIWKAHVIHVFQASYKVFYKSKSFHTQPVLDLP
jgi:hypothetical protein